MLKVIDDKVYLRRGDDEALDVEVKVDGVDTDIGETETLTLTVRELPDAGSPVIFESTSAPGSKRIVINHADTADAEYGQYSADIQLLTADGYRKTIWPDIDVDNPPNPYALQNNFGNFIILPEVTMG